MILILFIINGDKMMIKTKEKTIEIIEKIVFLSIAFLAIFIKSFNERIILFSIYGISCVFFMIYKYRKKRYNYIWIEFLCAFFLLLS